MKQRQTTDLQSNCDLGTQMDSVIIWHYLDPIVYFESCWNAQTHLSVMQWWRDNVTRECVVTVSYNSLLQDDPINLWPCYMLPTWCDVMKDMIGGKISVGLPYQTDVLRMVKIWSDLEQFFLCGCYVYTSWDTCGGFETEKLCKLTISTELFNYWNVLSGERERWRNDPIVCYIPLIVLKWVLWLTLAGKMYKTSHQ